MDRITKVTEEAVRRYFNSLFKFGYKKYTDVDRLLVLTYIEELLEHELFGFMTEEDYNEIVKAIGCIAVGTCLVDFPSYATYDDLIKNKIVDNVIRTDESGIFRVCEASITRVKM